MKKINHYFWLIIAAAIIFPNIISAQQDGDEISIGKYHILHSEILDEDRPLLISLPNDYDQTTIGYPVIFLLYGDQVRGYFAETVHILNRFNNSAETPGMILVGVANVDRYRDNLPVNRDGSQGGADNFLNFFTDELIPFINSNWRIKDFRILIGPQAGAAFGVYSMMKSPDVFDAYILNNPFWNNHISEFFTEQSKPFFKDLETLNKFLFISYGSYDDMEESIEQLKNWATLIETNMPEKFQFELNMLSDEDRLDFIPPTGLKRGLRSLFSDYPFPDSIEVGGLDDLQEYYTKLSEKYGYEVEIPEFVMVMKGDLLHRQGKYIEALKIFERMYQMNPHSPNALFQLAGINQSLGNYEESLKYYQEFYKDHKEQFIRDRIAEVERLILMQNTD